MSDLIDIACPVCGEERTVARTDLHDLRCRDCRIMARLSRSNLPHNLRGKKVEGPLLGLAQSWAAGDIPVLTVHGGFGTGKTHFAAAAFRLALVKRQVTWIETARHMVMLQASFGDDDRHEALKAFTGTGPAVLDDLDKIVDRRAGLPKLFAAIDTRITHGNPILVTLNSSLDGFLNDWGSESNVAEAIVSRLRGGIVRKLTGPDKRRNQ